MPLIMLKCPTTNEEIAGWRPTSLPLTSRKIPEFRSDAPNVESIMSVCLGSAV